MIEWSDVISVCVETLEAILILMTGRGSARRLVGPFSLPLHGVLFVSLLALFCFLLFKKKVISDFELKKF